MNGCAKRARNSKFDTALNAKLKARLDGKLSVKLKARLDGELDSLAAKQDTKLDVKLNTGPNIKSNAITLYLRSHK
jgi:hypothetical protein